MYCDTTITLYMLNRVMGDVHVGIVIKSVGQKLPERWAAGDRHQNYACLDALRASPPSPSFPAFSSRSGLVIPRDTGGITVQWPSVTGRSFNESVSVGSL